MHPKYDVIIVGAGSSGCALAARLSEKASRRVLLIEAGPHFPTIEALPPEMAQAKFLAVSMPGHPNNWSFNGQIIPGRVVPMARGKVVGGSSAVNGTYFVRGRPEDFDAWSRLGNPDWAFDKVLPYFVRSERDLDVAGDAHGSDGPMPIRRPTRSELRPVSSGFIEACRDLGFPAAPDWNAVDGAVGAGPIPRNCIDGIRVNTAIAYLADCLDRPNLTLLDECEVDRVLIQGGVATGVAARRHGEDLTLEAGEVVLCTGGIKTPQLLQISGVGPADLLRSFDIAVVQDAPVGRNIQDHPSVYVPFRVERQDETRLDDHLTPIQVGLTHTAPGSSDTGDLQINCVSATFRQIMGDGAAAKPFFGLRLPGYLRRPFRTLKALSGASRRVVVAQALSQDNLQLLCTLHLEKSRGEIRIKSPSARDHPHIDFNYLSHPDDVSRMRDNVRVGVDILSAKPFQRLGTRIVGPESDILSDDARLDAWIRDRLGTAFHTSGGARMGPSGDNEAVVDQHGRVHGVAGLRVCDLSILPSIVRRGTAATAVLIGERMAAFFD